MAKDQNRQRLRAEDRPRGIWKYMIVISLLSCIIVIPYGYLFRSAFLDNAGSFTLNNWSVLWKDTQMAFSRDVIPAAGPSIAYSFYFAATMSTLVVLIAVPSAYAMSRCDFPGRKLMARLLIVLDAFPSVALLTPYILLLTRLHLTNKLFGVIILKVAIYLPGAVWLMKGFFDHINWDIEWAAIVDGASRFTTFLRIIVPAAKPGISVILVNSFLNGWGEYILINIFIYGKTTTMSSILGRMFDWESMSYMVERGILAAGCVTYIVPIISGFALSQKTLLKVNQGGSKQ